MLMLPALLLILLNLLQLLSLTRALPSHLASSSSSPHSVNAPLIGKRGQCARSCPYGQMHGGGCTCVHDPSVIVGCQLLCVAKPEIKPSPWLAATGGKPRGEVVCGKQTRQGYPLRARQQFSPGPEAFAAKSWDIQQFWDSNDEASSNIHYTGSISEKGEMTMYATEGISAHRNYIVGITVTGFTYYYTLEGYTYCSTTNEDLVGTISQIDVLEAPSTLVYLGG